MADFDSSLPVRTTANEELQVKTKAGSVVDSNLKQLNGVAPSVNTGNADAGTQRVVLATNQPTVAVSFSTSYKAPRIDHNTVASIGAGASSTHNFTPSANFRLEDVYASSSGQMKVEIKVGPTGSEVTKAVLFTSKGHLSEKWSVTQPVQVTTADSVKVVRTNLDNQSMDVYSSIQGFDE
jgi:outer membrane biosynthesis protein TonB